MTKYAIYFMQQWVGDHPEEDGDEALPNRST